MNNVQAQSLYFISTNLKGKTDQIPVLNIKISNNNYKLLDMPKGYALRKPAEIKV